PPRLPLSHPRARPKCATVRIVESRCGRARTKAAVRDDFQNVLPLRNAGAGQEMRRAIPLKNRSDTPDRSCKRRDGVTPPSGSKCLRKTHGTSEQSLAKIEALGQRHLQTRIEHEMSAAHVPGIGTRHRE